MIISSFRIMTIDHYIMITSHDPTNTGQEASDSSARRRDGEYVALPDAKQPT